MKKSEIVPYLHSLYHTEENLAKDKAEIDTIFLMKAKGIITEGVFRKMIDNIGCVYVEDPSAWNL